MENVDMIVDAQRLAAAANGCAFWDWRAKMGGKGSMQQWVVAGMAQYDHVHFTGPGYKMVGDGLFRDLMSQYEVFLKARTVASSSSETDTADGAVDNSVDSSVNTPVNSSANSPVNAQ
jgi:hypothetical protein